jgi:hypothetical protein
MSRKRSILDQYIDSTREDEWEREHYWPDALIVNGHDIGKERRDKIRAMNTARQSMELEEYIPAIEPTPEEIEEIAREMKG